MLTKTRDKLNEAKFFLNHMQEAECGPDAKTQAGQDAFRYFMNAFLSAFRSITRLPAERNVHEKNYQQGDWVMEREYGHVEGFTDWYQEKHEALNDDQVFGFLKEQRNRVIHFKKNKSVKIGGRSNRNAAGLVRLIDALAPLDIKIDLTVPQEKPCETTFLFAEMTSDICRIKDIVTICGAYLEVLEKIVDECESKFLVEEEVVPPVP